MEESVQNDYDDDDDDDNVTVINNGNHHHQHHDSHHYQQKNNHRQKCINCDSLEKMLCLRDRTIMKLIEDRDQLKIKLTRTMNENIELTRQLLRYEGSSFRKNNNAATTNNQKDKNHQLIDNQKQQKELQFYHRRCQELEEQNQQMKFHLYSLRNVFVELSQQQNNDHHYDEHGNEDDDDVDNESYQDLPSSVSANKVENIVENDIGNHHQQQQKQLPSQNVQTDEHSTAKLMKDTATTTTITNDDTINRYDSIINEPIISNFDRWYNS